MKNLFLLLAGCWLILLTASSHPQAAGRPPQSSSTNLSQTSSSQRALLDRYCVTCHNQKLKTAGLALDTLDVSNVSGSAATWEKVIQKMRAGAMPPVGRPRPDAASSDALRSWLEAAIDRAAAARPNPGRTEAFHRLNRAEYQNAIRDLLALDIDVTSLLPSDDASYGFDNIAGVLKVSSTLLDRYMSVARHVSRVAIGAALPPTADTFRIRADFAQEDRSDALPLGTRGGIAIRYTFPRDGLYELKIARMETTQGGFEDRGQRATLPHQLEVGIDGQRVHLFTIAPPQRAAQAPQQYGDITKTEDLKVRIPVKAGSRMVVVTFIARNPSALAETVRQPFARFQGGSAEADTTYQPDIGSVTISGPFEATGPGDTESRRRIFVCSPERPADEGTCAREILSTLARRAYRRPIVDADLQNLLTFYDDGRTKAGFEAGIAMALRALLVSPEFLFRIERDPAPLPPGAIYEISDLELASRLSFFLWSSIPDEELLGTASRGTLTDPAVLERQVRRMLADPRSQALTTNFAGQWLYLRNLPAAVPNEWLYPNFNDNLRQDFRRETELFFDSMLRENRSVLELVSADYTFVNERLARHYGIQDVHGTHFRRVTLAGENRRGLLGHGSILTATSYPDRTSVVKRGAWILENLLGAPPPPPPPDVPPLPANGSSGKALSLRERMEQHRRNPVCASCHAPMDPLGFALENFDPTGRWRTSEDFTAWSNQVSPIDVSATLPNGAKFDGPAGLRAYLLSRSDEIVASFTRNLLTYAVGRGVEYYDMPAVRKIVRDATGSKYSFSSLIVGIAKSTPFRMRTAHLAPASLEAQR